MKNKLRAFLSRLLLYIPLRRNGLVFVIFVGGVLLFLRQEYYGEASRFTPFLNVFVWLLGVFATLVLGVGLLYTLFCWLYLLTNSGKLKVDLVIGLEDGQKGRAGEVPVRLSVSKVFMPVLGYLKVWILFEDRSQVGPILMSQFSGGWRDLLVKEGYANLQLERRAQYKVKGYILSFEDYLQFFRFSLLKKTKKSFYLYAQERNVPNVDIPPSKAKEELEKVKTSKRVEGDFLNYKDFESGDDVRRIVWKIFAKSKELVVRIPEVINPYASHLHFFASFQNTLFTDGGYATGMLDYYKDIIFTTCTQIEQSGRRVEFSMDQVVGDSLIIEKKDQLAYFLSCAVWQEYALNEQFPTMSASSVVCVSSLVPADQVEELVSVRGASLIIVRVSHYLDEKNVFNWANVILRKEKQTEISKLRWMLSPQRRKLKNNEKRIAELAESTNFQGHLI